MYKAHRVISVSVSINEHLSVKDFLIFGTTIYTWRQ